LSEERKLESVPEAWFTGEKKPKVRTSTEDRFTSEGERDRVLLLKADLLL
jgi:hypothetical protein